MRKNWPIFFLLILFTSCSMEIELNQPAYQSKVVVDGFIESNGFAHVFLTKSSPFLTKYDSASIRESFLNTASVKLICSNGDSEILTLFRQNTFFPPFIYKSIRMKGISGETYSLEIRSQGKVITASTSIPAMPNLTSFYMASKSDSSGVLQVTVSSDSNKLSYLFIQYRSQLDDQNFHPAGIPVYKLESSPPIFTLNVYRCDESNLTLLKSKKSPYSDWPKNYFSKKDTVFVKMGLVDATSYQVLKSLFSDLTMRNNPFAFNSEGIQSNIVGGIGRWTGIGMAALQVYP